ncbi:MAG: tyrosinase family protein [Acidobacteriota bacterium]
MEDLFTSNLTDDSASSNGFGRRIFIKGLGFVSLGLIMGTFGGCEKIIEDIKNRPIRRRLRSGSPEVDADIDTYRQAVTLMKNLDTSNPGDQRSWLNQATIHGIPAHFNFCEHSTDHFFDWHRAYLVNFERIIQKLTNKPKFGLPYWNWNQDPAIHSAFLDPSSSLFLARNRTSMSGSTSTTTAELNPIFADTNFFTFGSQVEGTPHNNVHSYIGGTFGGYASARDPLFWMHHCMVDYCWAKWNIEMGNNNTNDSTWLNHPNTHFVDADGNPNSMTAAVTILLPLLSYQYESSAIGSSPAKAEPSKAEFQKLESRLKAGANVRFEIKQRVRLADKAAVSIARPLSKETKLSTNDFASIVNAEAARDKVFVSIEYAQVPPSSDFYVRVYVNLPNANSNTPTTDPHYAGSFSFFGTAEPNAPAGEHRHQPKFLVNITNTLQRLNRTQAIRAEAPLSIQLVPVPYSGQFEKADTQLLLEKIEIITTPVIVNPPAE